MAGWFIALVFLLGILPSQDAPTVNRVFVTTPYNASIIFEYANAALPEGQPATPAAVECLTSQLKATGLFSDIQVVLNPVEGAQGKVDVDILPMWNSSREKYLVAEITIDGFTALDESLLKEQLGQRGLKSGVPLLQYPLPAIRKMSLDSVREIYKFDSQKMYDAEEELSGLAFRLEASKAHSIKLRFTKIGTPLCQ